LSAVAIQSAKAWLLLLLLVWLSAGKETPDITVTIKAVPIFIVASLPQFRVLLSANIAEPVYRLDLKGRPAAAGTQKPLVQCLQNANI
jgi:hypothetical protein